MSLRTCKYCGSEIADKSGRGRVRLFCSLRCTQRYHDVRKRLLANNSSQIRVVCVGCGKEFVAKNKTIRYCSLSCAERHDRRYYCRILRRQKKGVAWGGGAGERQFSDIELRILKDIETENDPNYVKPKRTKALASDCDKDFKCRTEPFGDISREDMMALVAKRNDSWSDYHKMLRMPPDEFRKAYAELTDKEQKLFKAFYMSEHGLKPAAHSFSMARRKGNGFLERIHQGKTLFERVSDAIRFGQLGSIRSGRIYKVTSGNEA